MNKIDTSNDQSPQFDTSQFTMLSMSCIELNEGQLPGLPANPRGIKKKKFEKLKNNIAKYPEMLVARSLLVYPLDESGERYIIIGGNMRYRAMSELKHHDAPVFIIPRETPVERLLAYTILDNGDFGDWDWDLLANEWPEDDLNDWGVNVPKSKGDGDDLSDQINLQYKIEVDCANESDQEELFNQLTEQGYKCRLLTL
nr:MAG TPA: ParB-like nuclease domain protein, cytoskeleton, bactofilin, CTP, CELL [Caudoviricetes sp.]